MYLVGGGIEVDLPVAYQQLIEQIFLTAAGLERVGAFRRVRDTVELDAQGQNVKNIAAGGFALALSPAGADGFLSDAVVATARLAPDSIAMRRLPPCGGRAHRRGPTGTAPGRPDGRRRTSCDSFGALDRPGCFGAGAYRPNWPGQAAVRGWPGPQALRRSGSGGRSFRQHPEFCPGSRDSAQRRLQAAVFSFHTASLPAQGAG